MRLYVFRCFAEKYKIFTINLTSPLVFTLLYIHYPRMKMRTYLIKYQEKLIRPNFCLAAHVQLHDYKKGN